MLTPSSLGAVRIRTQATFTGTTWEHLTFGIQQTIASGGGTYDLLLGKLTTNGRNMKFEVYVTAQENGVDNSVRSGVIMQSAYRSGGAVTLLGAHLSSIQGAGNLNSDPMNFALNVSGDDVRLRVTNAHATSARVINLSVRWSRQEGGMNS